MVVPLASVPGGTHAVASRVLQDAHELANVHSAVSVHLVGHKDHLLQLLVSHLLAKLVGDSFQIFKRDVGFLLGEEDECFL